MTELKLTNISKMTDEELKVAIEDCFEEAPNTTPIDRLAFLMEAQFYETEVDRRNNTGIERRSFWLEIAVIVLILFEIILSIYGIRLTIKEDKADAALMDKQNLILNNLQTSTQATAGQLKEELDMEYRVVINPQPVGSQSIMLYNNSRSEIFLWGVKVGRDRAVAHPRGPSTIAERTAELISFMDYYPNLVASGVVSFDLYLKNAANQEFVWSGRFDPARPTGNVTVVPNGALRAEQWSATLTLSPAPAANP